MAQEASFDKLSSGQTFYFYLHQQCSLLLLPLAKLLSVTLLHRGEVSRCEANPCFSLH